MRRDASDRAVGSPFAHQLAPIREVGLGRLRQLVVTELLRILHGDHVLVEDTDRNDASLGDQLIDQTSQPHALLQLSKHGGVITDLDDARLIHPRDPHVLENLRVDFALARFLDDSFCFFR